MPHACFFAFGLSETHILKEEKRGQLRGCGFCGGFWHFSELARWRVPFALAGAPWCLAVKCKSDLVCGLINKFIISCHSCVRVRHACHVIAQPRACAILSAPLSEVMWLVSHYPHLAN